jgi:hypothetical protein
MQRRLVRAVLVFAMAFGALAAPAAADHDGNPDSLAMAKQFFSPNATGAINSDLAFWGDRAYAGNYDSLRIFDISNPASPVLLSDFPCHGPQNDAVVWQNKLLFSAIDRTQTGPECGSTDTIHPDGTPFHDDPNGWEGVRIFDVSNPTAPKFIKGVYSDCGAHTITLWPKNPAHVLLYVSSYPLRPGPTCGQVRGPEAGRDPLHGVIQVIDVPVHNPKAAKEIAEPRITYPDDADNQFVWSEHGLPGPPVFEPAARACHDIGVFVELRLAAAACAEQGQLWRIKPNGLPDTAHPIWVFDDQVDETGTTGNPADPGVVVDFFHSATFSWDGKVVNFIDESFDAAPGACPPTTTAPIGGDSGRMFFLDRETGTKLSHFMIPRVEPTAYCSAHLGNAVRTEDANLLVNAWYEGGIDVVDFSDPSNPTEVAFWDETSDNWSAYWYEGPGLGAGQFPVYGTDGVENPPAGEGFQVFRVLSDVTTEALAHLNPQTQETLVDGSPTKKGKGAKAKSSRVAKARGARSGGSWRSAANRLAAP